MTKDYTIAPDGHDPFVMMLDSSFYADWALLQYVGRGCWPEPEVSSLMVHVVRPGDTVIDVGANIGFYACLLSRLVGPEGHVIAFEPGTNNLPRLHANIEKNEMKNVIIEEKGVFSKCGFTKFNLNPDSGQNAIWSFAYPGETIDIEVTTLDEVNLANPKLAKIDVEGSEEHVLRGAAALLSSGHPQFITCELNPSALKMMGSDGEKLRGFMREFDYQTFAIHEQQALPTLIPPNTKLIPRKHNTNVLFAKLASVGEYWPEIMIGPEYQTLSDGVAK